MSDISRKEQMRKETKQMIVFAAVVNIVIFLIDLYHFSANTPIPLLCIISVICAWPRRQPKPLLRRICFICLGLAMIIGGCQIVYCIVEIFYKEYTGNTLPLAYIIVLIFFVLLPVYVGLYKRIKTRKRNNEIKNK